MGVVRIKRVEEKDNNGQVTRVYYVAGNGDKYQVNSNEPLLFFDDQTNKVLTKSQTKAYLETMEEPLEDDEDASVDGSEDDEEEEVEIKETVNKDGSPSFEAVKTISFEVPAGDGVISTSKPVVEIGDVKAYHTVPLKENKVEVEPMKKYQYFTPKENYDISGLDKLWGLDPTKDYRTQSVSVDTFKKSIGMELLEEYVGYHQSTDRGMFNWSLSDFVSGYMTNRMINKYIIEDKDTAAYHEKMEYEARVAQHEASVLRSADIYANSIQKPEGELTLEETRAKAKDEYIEKNKEPLIYNEANYNDVTRKQVLNDSHVIIRGREGEAAVNAIHTALLATLTGNGNPRNAFHQFLNQEKLAQGEYVYNDKAIQKFIKDVTLTEKEVDKYTEAITPYDAVVRIRDEAMGRYENIEEPYKPNYKMDPIRQARYDEAFAKYEKEKATNLLEIAKVYKQINDLHQKRSIWYTVCHPFNTYHEGCLVSEMKNFILDNVPKKSQAEIVMKSYLNAPLKSEAADACYDTLLQHTDDHNFQMSKENPEPVKMESSTVEDSVSKAKPAEKTEVKNEVKTEDKKLVEPVDVSNEIDEEDEQAEFNIDTSTTKKTVIKEVNKE